MNRAARLRQQKLAPKTPRDADGAPADDFVKTLIEKYRAVTIETPDERMCHLGTTYVESNLEAIFHDLKMLRIETNAHFLAMRDRMQRGEEPYNAELSWKLSKYPVNCCLEIVLFMMDLMMHKPVTASAKGLLALRELHNKGGTFKIVWGALRGKYFQNAIQAGSYYIDVANDTVDPNKDNVEILPLAQSGLKNIDTYHEFSDIAEPYWNCRLVPNVFFPNLAPFLPIVTFFDNGVIRFDSLNHCLFPMNVESNLRLAHDYVFNNDRRKDGIKARWTQLETVLRDKQNPPAHDLLHFDTTRNERHLVAAFNASAKARPSIRVQKIKDVVGIQQHIWQPSGL